MAAGQPFPQAFGKLIDAQLKLGHAQESGNQDEVRKTLRPWVAAARGFLQSVADRPTGDRLDENIAPAIQMIRDLVTGLLTSTGPLALNDLDEFRDELKVVQEMLPPARLN